MAMSNKKVIEKPTETAQVALRQYIFIPR